MGAESNKIVHQLLNAIQDGTGITCLAWVSNTTSKKSAGHGPAGRDPSWTDIFETQLDVTNDQDSLDLPRDLSLIDIESSLPKLSVLPAGGTS
jgi:anaphase-promoting complex subunit 4